LVWLGPGIGKKIFVEIQVLRREPVPSAIYVLLFLAVVGTGTMLAEEMLVPQMRRGLRCCRSEGQGLDRHVGHGLKGDGGFHGLGSRWSPNEWAMIPDENGRNAERIDPLETLYDDVAGFPLIFAIYFLGRHTARERDRAVEVIAMGGAEAGNLTRSLSKCHGRAGVGVNHGTDAGEIQEQATVGGCIGRRAQITLHDITIKVHDDHVFRLQLGVIHTARLDGENTALLISYGNVSKGEIDEAGFRQFQISGETFLSKRLVV